MDVLLNLEAGNMPGYFETISVSQTGKTSKLSVSS